MNKRQPSALMRLTAKLLAACLAAITNRLPRHLAARPFISPFCEWSMIWKVKKRHKPSNQGWRVKIDGQQRAQNCSHGAKKPANDPMPRLPGGPCHHRFRRHNGPLRALKTLISRIFVQSMPFQCPTWPPDWPSIELAIQEAIRTGQWGQYHSPLIKSLQKRLAEYLKSGPIRLCCSGTAALELALRCCRIRETDEVILAAYDFPGNFRTVELLGAKPVLVDATSNFIAGRRVISPHDAEQVAAPAPACAVTLHTRMALPTCTHCGKLRRSRLVSDRRCPSGDRRSDR